MQNRFIMNTNLSTSLVNVADSLTCDRLQWCCCGVHQTNGFVNSMIFSPDAPLSEAISISEQSVIQ